ncbi:hypothetical protein [Methylobacterium durans]|uniref:Uncharacterized protein n=1 Tax=Methylobacterium durans TaxID=2202825 RepID=A0A2U8WCE1_9HYPH|nr:hypothetical protein [Methylobacterium durans]AWN42976.1 hypothetical protein DK389_23855 [Methylobacterium durans]
MTLTRCRRCRQPILTDARCCPHCAVANPSRRRRRGRALLLGLLAIAAGLAGYRYAAGPSPDRGAPPATSANVTTIPKTVQGGPIRRHPREGEASPR